MMKFIYNKFISVIRRLKLNSLFSVSWTFDVADVNLRKCNYLRDVSFKGNMKGAAELG